MNKDDILNQLALDIENKYKKKSEFEQVPTTLRSMLNTPADKLKDIVTVTETDDSFSSQVQQQCMEKVKDFELRLRSSILKELNQVNYKRYQCCSKCYTDTNISRIQAFNCLKECHIGINKAKEYVQAIQKEIETNINTCIHKELQPGKDFLQNLSGCVNDLSSHLYNATHKMKSKFQKYK